MVRIENRCCDCAVPAYPCLGENCPNRRVEVHYCDICGAEISDGEEFGDEDGREFCDECIEELEEAWDDD